MRTLFISEKYIKENSAIDENTDYKRFYLLFGNVKYNTYRTF